jgi:hypothetical protein
MSVEIENYGQMNGNGTGVGNDVLINQNDVGPSSSSSSSSSSGALGTGSNSNDEISYYDTAFPSLPAASTNPTVGSAWSNTENKLSIKRHLNTTQVFRVPIEERKYKDVNFGNETNKRCEDIASKLGVKVELCCSKDQTLHIVISGLEEKVLEAKRAIVNELSTERDFKMKIPKEQHKFLIGKAGSILKELQEKTCTKIQVPKSDSNSDLVSITGPKEGIEQAIHEIQLICGNIRHSSVELRHCASACTFLPLLVM